MTNRESESHLPALFVGYGVSAMNNLPEKIRAGRIISGTILIILLLAISTSTAMACHKGKPHGKDAPASCDDLPDIELPDLLVRWGGEDEFPGIEESENRLCSATQVAPDQTSGTYSCAFNTVKIMYNFDLMVSSIAHRRGDDWRCEPYVTGGWLCPDTEYSLSWSGDCTTTDGCDITIVNRFSHNGVIGHSVDRMTLEAFAKVSGSATHNPFESVESIEVNSLNYTMFGAKGNNKVLAQCGLAPTDEWPVNLYITPVESE